MKTYILNPNKRIENIPSINKERQKRLDLEKKLGYSMTDWEYNEYKKRFRN
jgi:hypothetical protein